MRRDSRESCLDQGHDSWGFRTFESLAAKRRKFGRKSERRKSEGKRVGVCVDLALLTRQKLADMTAASASAKSSMDDVHQDMSCQH